MTGQKEDIVNDFALKCTYLLSPRAILMGNLKSLFHVESNISRGMIGFRHSRMKIFMKHNFLC